MTIKNGQYGFKLPQIKTEKSLDLVDYNDTELQAKIERTINHINSRVYLIKDVDTTKLPKTDFEN